MRVSLWRLVLLLCVRHGGAAAYGENSIFSLFLARRVARAAFARVWRAAALDNNILHNAQHMWRGDKRVAAVCAQRGARRGIITGVARRFRARTHLARARSARMACARAMAWRDAQRRRRGKTTRRDDEEGGQATSISPTPPAAFPTTSPTRARTPLHTLATHFPHTPPPHHLCTHAPLLFGLLVVPVHFGS